MSGEFVPSGTKDHEACAGSGMSEAVETLAGTLTPANPDVGQQLRSAREAKGLTVADVSRILKLSTRQVEALEANDWSNLPCNTIVRGFVRNYARLLELKPELLMSALEASQMPQVPELEMPVESSASIPYEGRVDRRDYARVFSGAFVLALAVLAYFFIPPAWWQSTLSALKTAIHSQETVVEKNIESAKNEKKEPEAAVIPPAIPATTVPSEASVMPQASSVPALPPASTAFTLSSDNVLKFSFAKSAWVEVRDRNGEIIFSQLSQAGSQREIEGKPPFALVIGNAANVVLQYKGKAVDLSKRSKDDVARLTLE